MKDRKIAFEILKEVEEGGNSSYLLDRKLSRIEDEKKKAFITEIVLGVLRWRNRLDYAISYHSNKRIEKLSLDVIIALRMGIYQLEFMRVPDYAAVNESVELVKAPWKRSFVNGLLRSYLREGVRYPSPEDALMHLTYTLSTPEWKARRWLKEFGFERACKLAEFYNSKPPVYIRLNPDKVDMDSLLSMLSLDGIEAQPCDYLKDCLKIKKGNVKTTPFLKKGYFYVQDAGSQMAGWVIRQLKPALVWDCCFAPGGKAIHLALLGMKVVASDVSFKRTRFALVNVKSSGVKFPVLVADARRPPFKVRFPLTLVDAPCSSLGVVHRNPELKWKIKEENLKKFKSLQKEILNRVMEVSKRALYVVCSQEKEETLEVIQELNLKTEKIPDEFFLKKPPLKIVENTWFTQPDLSGMDGLFYALVKKSE